MAVTYDSRAGSVIFYLDGKAVKECRASGETVYFSGPGCPYETLPLTLSGIAAFPRMHWQFAGFMREAKVYDRALSSGEILGDYEETKGVTSIVLLSRKAALEKQMTGRLIIAVADKDSGADLKARLLVKGEDGRYCLPSGAYAYGTERLGWFYGFGASREIKVKPGRYEITAVHGFEYVPSKVTVAVADRQQREVKVGLQRLVDLPRQGWFCGEHHIQYIGHGKHKYDSMGLLDAARICEAEGVNYASFVQGLETDASSVCGVDFIARGGAEFCPDLGGHLCCMNVSKRPRSNSMVFENMEVIDDVAPQGGLAIYTHPSSGMGQAGDPTCSREMPVAVALGKMPVWDVSYGALRSFENPLVADWYRYLNLGFKLAAGASTDVYLNNQAEERTAGVHRTYVKTDSLSWPSIVKAYRQGRTFITNGPLLILQADGKDPGETIEVKSANESVGIHLEAYGVNGIEKIELVENGIVTDRLETGGSRSFTKDITRSVRGSGWLAARCYGVKGECFGVLAHTSPVYVQCAGEKMKVSQDDIDYFCRWLVEYRKFIPIYCEYRKQKVENSKKLLERIDEAMAVFQKCGAAEK